MRCFFSTSSHLIYVPPPRWQDLLHCPLLGSSSFPSIKSLRKQISSFLHPGIIDSTFSFFKPRDSQFPQTMKKKKIHKLKVSFYNSRLFSFLFILHLLFVVILCKFYGWAGNPQISLPQPPRLQGFSFLVHFNLRRTQPALDVVFMKCCPALQEL